VLNSNDNFDIGAVVQMFELEPKLDPEFLKKTGLMIEGYIERLRPEVREIAQEVFDALRGLKPASDAAQRYIDTWSGSVDHIG